VVWEQGDFSNSTMKDQLCKNTHQASFKAARCYTLCHLIGKEASRNTIITAHSCLFVQVVKAMSVRDNCMASPSGNCNSISQ
jgi:hypothetical protein